MTAALIDTAELIYGKHTEKAVLLVTSGELYITEIKYLVKLQREVETVVRFPDRDELDAHTVARPLEIDISR